MQAQPERETARNKSLLLSRVQGLAFDKIKINMRKDYPYLGCVLLIVAFLVEFVALYFIANLFIPLPWWASLLIVIAINIGIGIYKRIKS